MIRAVHELRTAAGRAVHMARHGMLHLKPLQALTVLLARAGTANVWLMYTKDLTEPIATRAAAVALEIDIARGKSLTEAATLSYHGDADRARGRTAKFRRRVRDGSLCFVARVDGEMVAYNWIRMHSAVGARDLPMRLEPQEIYTTDAYTARAWRGKGIHTALNSAMLRVAQDSGHRCAYTLLRLDNPRSWVAMPRVGWKRTGILIHFRPDRAPANSFWYVHGKAYPMPLHGGLQRCTTAVEETGSTRCGNDQHGTRSDVGCADDTEVLRWAARHHSFERHERVRTWPWARTYRLGGDAGDAYLKIVPRAQARTLNASVILSRRFPSSVAHTIACDRQQGWLLTRGHGGKKLDRNAPERYWVGLLETYARMQCDCRSDAELRACLPRIDSAASVGSLLDFLGGRHSTGIAIDAAWFLGEREARGRHQALRRYRALLEQHITLAQQLPETLNHCNLLLSNTAVTANGEHVLYSWNEAVYGPAGLSLHALFGGCLTPNRMLIDPRSVPTRSGSRERLLERYIATLVRGGYAGRCSLRRCLPASITVGVLRYLLSFAQYQHVDAEDCQIIRRNLQRRLDDLLQLCALLASRSRETTMLLSAEHLEDGHPWLAQHLVEAYLEEHPRDAAMIGRLAKIHAERDRVGRAKRAYRRALALEPDRAELHEGLGQVLMKKMDCSEAATHFRRSIELDPGRAEARIAAERALRLQRCWAHIRSLNGGETR